MDKRFLLALVLTAVVVVATPWLFGTQSSRGVNKTGRDTALVSDSTPGLRPGPQTTLIEQPAVPPASDSSRNAVPLLAG